jgi:type III pantothenate kinase
MIQRYEQEFNDLTFFVTGGDAQYFDFVGKNNIFANENLTLKGLYEIYQLNAQ